MFNEPVANGYFMSCHLLHRCNDIRSQPLPSLAHRTHIGLDGYKIRHPAEQRGSLCFLERVKKDVGWRMTWMVRHLEHQWGELSGLDSSI